MPRVSAGELQFLARNIFEALQVPRDEAVWVAELLVHANLVRRLAGAAGQRRS